MLAVLATMVSVVSGTASHAQAAKSAAIARPPIRCTAPGQRPITVVLVHGAWADNESWSGELSELQRDGCAVRAADNPVRNLKTDAAAVANFVRAIPGPVLLVGHSYGGSVITNAAAEVHNVVGLVYVDAFAPAVGESASELGGETSAVAAHPASQLFDEIPGAPKDAGNIILKKNAFLRYFASDVPRPQALSLWASQTVASSQALGAPSQYATWKTLPSWYFISSADQIITPQSMLAMAHRAHSQITLFHGGSHLTLISHPAAVTAVIAEALSSLLAVGK
ncbi:alpha/beta hydrolase [Streptomyces sp. TG1A-8]|uniref:alpha/beta fold hydrolase n=1 Tax=Streptomyces sp. TG1A-8 TaxID=3051385 RepID=UPI00265BD001|nr:alpha/beta hydrolase [Streptomyces sp. TG1A-8]MDO0929629.1 alpha/beta hydrolase [Streptomyces sp. TG1A-8]